MEMKLRKPDGASSSRSTKGKHVRNVLPVDNRDLENISPSVNYLEAFLNSIGSELANISPRKGDCFLLGFSVYSVIQVTALSNNPFLNSSSLMLLKFWDAFWLLFPDMIFLTIFIICAMAILFLVSNRGSIVRFAYPSLLSLTGFYYCSVLWIRSSGGAVIVGSNSFITLPLPIIVLFEALALFLILSFIILLSIFLVWRVTQTNETENEGLRHK